MIDSNDLTQEELLVLKGDRVGDTAHSARWIISVLRSLSKIPEDGFTDGFTDELEEKYRLLQEISYEPDVRCFLISHNFIDLAAFLLEYVNEPSKLVEITIGVLVSLCYDKEAVEKVSVNKDTVERILGFLRCYDSSILFQLIKLLQLMVWQITNAVSTLWTPYIKNCEYLGECIIFILKNSSCSDLLEETIHLLHYMTWTEIESSHLLIEVFKRLPDALVLGLQECFLEVIKTPEDNRACHHRKFIGKWLEIFEIVQDIPSINLAFEEESKWMDIIITILKPYKKDTLQFIQQDLQIIQQTVNIIEIWHSSDTKVPKEVIAYMAYITSKIDKTLDRCSEFDEPGSNELLSGLHTVTNEYWLKRIKLSDTDEILEIMHPLKPWACKYLTKLDNIEKEVIDSMFVKKKNNSITH